MSCIKDDGKPFYTRGPTTAQLLSLKLLRERGTTLILSADG